MSCVKPAGLYVDEVLYDCGVATNDTISMKHPLAFGSIVGAVPVRALAVATEALFSSIEIEHTWRSQDLSARSWLARFHDRKVLGVTAALRSGDGVEVQVLLGTYPARLREQMREVSAGLVPPGAWELPDGTDTALPAIDPGEVFDAKLPFQLADDATLSSPVAIKPICGRANVELISAHTTAVYGTRNMGPRLSAGPAMLSFWTGRVAGLALEVANVIHWRDREHVDSMAMAMRPWPVVKVFQERMRARTLTLLDDSYFDPMETSPC